MNLVEKACPVVITDRGGGSSILVFHHPKAGVQLVKGTIEPDEDPNTAALRELREEAGIVATSAITLGSHIFVAPGPLWHFALVSSLELPEKWTHWCDDDGGHEFAFHWHRLSDPPTAEWHPVFQSALAFIRTALSR